ncbi:SLC13 family permease [Leeuwenhoekiella palythoae]|uniref:Di-and tricarboxylate transporter n=1 Tax=Leeuwenhoekiella palythoae TaxID=573501 RepID=A0A1M5UE76_9FLAO|nr:SLC13 family permease [Leeuwenhoekiella palythoae]RXG27146.1 di/tricarboxylate transporter [Leeuwenhoekiella palythoae]SHH61269.1 Di-and tricarboxylate transporter [Leeuwenhoekiella palythoae]
MLEGFYAFTETYDLYITGISLIWMVFALIRGKRNPSYVFAGIVLLFLICGYIQVESILNAAITKSVLLIFIVVALSAAINRNMNLDLYLDRVLGGIRSPILFLGVLCMLVALISSVFNNTPVVIILIPYMMKMAEKYEIAPSKLLIPLSFAAILGGMLTLIGTSTNLVLNGLIAGSGLPEFGFADFLLPGSLVVIAGVLYLMTLGYYLLPQRAFNFKKKQDAVRKYFVEAKIPAASALSGLSLSESGLKEYKGVSLIELIRGSRSFEVVASRNMILQEGDRLIFSGSLTDVMQINAEERKLEFIAEKRLAHENKVEFVEISIPTNSSLDGKRVNETNFRQRYGATILAVHRNSEDLSGRIGELQLKSGDLLIVVPHINLTDALRADFYILSNVTQEQQPLSQKIKLGLGLVAIITAALIVQLDLFLTLGLILTLAVVLGFTSIQEIKNEFRLNLFVILVSSLLVGEVFMSTGLANEVSSWILNAVLPYGFNGVVLGLMLFTTLLTSFITNVAAVSIAFPLAYSISATTGIPSEALFLAVAFAASAAFMTPIGYQTNLLIMAPGDYRFKDFFKAGAPLTLIYLGVIWGYLYFIYT